MAGLRLPSVVDGLADFLFVRRRRRADELDVHRCIPGSMSTSSGGVPSPTHPWLRVEAPPAAILLGRTSNHSFSKQASALNKARTNLKHDRLYIIYANQIGSIPNGYYRFNSPRKIGHAQGSVN